MVRFLVAILLSLSASSTMAAEARMSNSHICHDSSSPYYARLKHFTSYSTMDACLKAGGHLPKQAKSASKQHATDSTYSRSKFGHGWDDADHDGQDTRQEVLIAQNTGQITLSSSGRVKQGRWTSMYSGKTLFAASALDIDHIVPLSWAWQHGADKWSQDRREQFANDQRNLVAVEASLNRSKGDKGLDEWLPPANQCQYIARFLRVLKQYQLNVSATEKAQFSKLRTQCKS
ncbi:HNH endonuclease family protein [Shewanella sp. A3A]|nr:HNH endonuclease family protein [Shewanella ferrihydritica]